MAYFRKIIFILLGVMVISNSSVAQERQQRCNLNFSKFISHGFQWTKSTSKDLYENIKSIWVDDYLGAWRNGKSVPESAWNFLRRSMIAPRSHALDPVQREKELRSFQWKIAFLDPYIELPSELASITKQWIGKALGFKGKPSSGRLAIIPNAIVGAVISDYIFRMGEEHSSRNLNDSKIMNAIGIPYLKSITSTFLLSPAVANKISTEHTKLLQKWVDELESNKIDRMLPPRIYQFQAEGILKSAEESAIFEALAYDALSEANQGKNPDADVHRILMEKMHMDPSFSSRTEDELNLLTLVFDPPIFLGQEQEDFSWLDTLRKGDLESYRKYASDKKSDLHLLYGTLHTKDPFILSLNKIFNKQLVPKLAYIYNNFGPHKDEIISDKVKKAQSILGFPLEKLSSISRLDLPIFSLEPSFFWPKNDGPEKALNNELDYWELAVSHPGFRDLLAKWKLSKPEADIDIAAEILDRSKQLYTIESMQRYWESKSKQKIEPGPQEICMLYGFSKGFNEQINSILSGAKVENSMHDQCVYFVGLALWRARVAEINNYHAGVQNAVDLDAKQEHGVEVSLNACTALGIRARLAARFGVSEDQFKDSLNCAANKLK